MSRKVGAVLVIGGGIAGMQSALDLADSGFRVYMVEKSPGIGGVMAQLDKTFPTNDCSMCIMAPKLVATGRHRNVTIYSNATVDKLDGSEGDFTVKVTEWPRLIDEAKCTGCGLCTKTCPIESLSEYDEGTKKRRAAYIKYAQTVPLLANIDREICIGCRLCEQICAAGAIDFDQKPKEIELNVGSIVLATGFQAYDPTNRSEFGYGIYKNVVLSTEFERILSATGPFMGHVFRPSDGRIPKKIAFLQCVGSRDLKPGSAPYCSSVCCMYALKEAVIAKEHCEDLEPTMFYMDIRAFGKEFEDYKVRSREEHGLRFIRARVASIEETPEEDLIVKFVQDGKVTTEVFDMVVLSVGFKPPKDLDKLTEVLGVKLNPVGYVATTEFEPMSTNVPGIYSCGAVVSPKDIPDTVAQASGAAALATAPISSERGTLEVVKEYPDDIEVGPDDEARIGVFICHCGINIGGVVNVPEVVEYAKTLPNVIYTERNLYTCSADTQGKITEKIKEHKLNRVIVASCTPRTHEPLFQNTLMDAGLNPYLFEMANIREHCSWVHMHDKPRATEKAKDLVRMAVSKSKLLSPLEKMKLEVNHDGVVIGGGLSGLTAAKGLARQGYKVHLIEKEAELGGNLRRVRSMPEGSDPQKILKELISEVESDELITVHKSTTIKAINGYVGNFQTIIIEGGEEQFLKHGAIIVATGAKEYVPTEYLYGENPKVMTQLELEEKLASGDLDAKTVVMIQCIGSRCEESTNCSRICCTEAVKNSLVIKQKDPETEVFVLHKDIRTYGFKEMGYGMARGMGVHFMLFEDDEPPEVSLKDGELKVEMNDRILGKKIAIKPDALVLSAGIRPLDTNEELAKMLKVPISKDGFFLEAHMKLRPVDFATEGVFLCGLAHGPKFADESISQALGAVARASTVLSKEYLEAEGIVSSVEEENCSGCGACVEICPYNAIELMEKDMSAAEVGSYLPRTIVVAQINPVVCKGCGSCASMCPSQAIDQKGFNSMQLLAMVRNAMM